MRSIPPRACLTVASPSRNRFRFTCDRPARDSRATGRRWPGGRGFGCAVLLLASVVAAGSPPPLTFVRHDVTSQNLGLLSEGFDLGDLDGDGRPDLIEGGETSLLWYHNPDWTPRPIAIGFRYSAGAAIAVADIDGDGRLDVVTGRYPVGAPGSRQMLWFANTPGGWVEHVLSSTAFCHDMAFGVNGAVYAWRNQTGK